jgi:(4S)-4-hydroxy-5-phosphonooxypentane-2,3-dione isomerase
MHIVHVSVQVKLEHVVAFIAATRDNARNSALEPGVLRFDALRSKDDPGRFVLVEIYRTPDDQAKHRETAHYLRWRDAVADMMAGPRQPEFFDGLIFSDLNTDLTR